MLTITSATPTVIDHIISSGNPFLLSNFIILFILIFIETAGIVTGFIPGDTILITAGAMAGAHHNMVQFLIYISIFACASWLGDAVNYWFGAFLTNQISKIPLLKKHLHEDTINQLASNFHPKRWLLFVILGRFLPFIRVLVPLLAHRLGLPFTLYIKMAAFASILWSSSIVSIGYFVGHFEISNVMLITVLIIVSIMSIILLKQSKIKDRIINLFVRK